ncbi:FIMAH domain-containing protein [Sporosarcina sp. NPDC096371]|uniref:FIMAH domain-containing protein n=1 Tax=Sporosarcina sp. NPDC096371 TaxID=3364530 RepID=UPI00381F4ADC
MKKFFAKKIVPFIAMLSLLMAMNPLAAFADQDSTSKNPQTIASTQTDWTNHKQLGQKLAEIEQNSSGKVKVEVLGYSQQGREIYSARVGTGKRVLLIDSEIHGNEKSGTEAILSMLNTLGTSDSGEVQAVLDALTIVAVPKLNGDGSDKDQRQNIISWEEVIENHPQLAGTKPAWYWNERNNGFDINRDFNPDLDYVAKAEDLPGTSAHTGFFLTKEARVLTDLYKSLRDEFGEVEAYVNLHHMGKVKLEGTDVDVTIALSDPPLGGDNNPKYADNWPKWDQEKSRRYVMAAVNGMNEKAEGGKQSGLARYTQPSTFDLSGIALGAFGLNGSASVLFEMAGQSPAVGYDQKLIDQVEAGLWGIANQMADGTVNDINGNDFYKLPKYWADTPPVSKPAQYSTDFTGYEIGKTPTDWTPIWQGQDEEWTIMDKPNRLQHIARSGVRGLTSDKVGEIYGSAEIFGLVKGSNVRGTLFQMGFHMSGSPGSENGIYADAQMPGKDGDGNTIRIMKRTAGAGSTLGSATLPFTLQEDEWYRVLLSRDAAALQVKIWPDGEEEPKKWQVTVVEDRMYGGKVGISHSNVGTVNEYAYIGVGIGGKRAPHAPKDLLKPSEPISASEMKKLVERFAKEGEFSNDSVSRLLTTHLTAIILYEKQEQAEKIVKHMNGFITLLDQHKKNGSISEKAYNTLKGHANSIIKQWQ